MRRWIRAWFVGISVGSLASCTKSPDVAQTPTDDFKKPHPAPAPTTTVLKPPPTKHRASAACTKTEQDIGMKGRKAPVEGEPCTVDTDCKKQKLGRCSSGACTYDECRADADCGKGLCRCEEFGNRGWFCFVGGDCTTDASCGAGGWCSPSFGTQCGPHQGVVGYWCHTSKDTCTNDADCNVDGKSWGYCAFHKEVGHWACGYNVCKG